MLSALFFFQSLKTAGVGEGGTRFCDVHDVLKFLLHNSKTICHRAAKVDIVGKVSVLAFQKHQDHFDRCYEAKVGGSKVRNLSPRTCLCLKRILAFFWEFFLGGKIYCYAIVFGPNFKEGKKFSGGQTASGGAPPLWKKASLLPHLSNKLLQIWCWAVSVV